LHQPAPRNLTDIGGLLASSDVTTDISIHWGEMDALGHVNNVVYFRYLESARVSHIRALGFDELRSMPSPQGGKIGFILQATSARFRKPLFYPDALRVTSRLRSIDADRFTLEHEIISTQQSCVAALGEGTIVTFDYATKAKVPVPDELRARLMAMRKAER
jgi:acyl-CoA thioester hydrolase